MNAFLMSPFSIPILIVAIVVGLPILSSTVVKLAKMRQEESKTGADVENALKAEIEGLRKRVENLETIVLNLEKHL